MKSIECKECTQFSLQKTQTKGPLERMLGRPGTCKTFGEMKVYERCSPLVAHTLNDNEAGIKLLFDGKTCLRPITEESDFSEISKFLRDARSDP